MNKEEIIDYVMTTPNNPNKAVLEGMLDSFSDGEGGGGSSRVLLYENDAVIVDQDGISPIIYTMATTNLTTCPWVDELSLSIEVDGEVVLTENINSTSNTDAYIGLSSPGDTAGISDGTNVGATFVGSAYNSERYICMLNLVILNSNVFAKGTHSVKIYKEV